MKKNRETEKALQYYKLFKTYNDSFFDETKSEQIAKMQTKYETEKKEKENTILKKNNIQNYKTFEIL